MRPDARVAIRLQLHAHRQRVGLRRPAALLGVAHLQRRLGRQQGPQLGHIAAVRGTQQAPPADLDALPDYVPAAFIAIEDRRFYKHMGVDAEGLTRAVMRNFSKGRVVQGGSTLTQQLAKNLFLSSERTVLRKGQELVIAYMLETVLSKARRIDAECVVRGYITGSAKLVDFGIAKIMEKIIIVGGVAAGAATVGNIGGGGQAASAEDQMNAILAKIFGA